MEKRKLSRIPISEAPPNIMEMSQNADIDIFISAETIPENKILLLNFFETSNLQKGVSKAALRTFLSEGDYITQDTKKSKARWLTGRIDSVLDIGWYGKNKNFAFVDSQSRELFEKRFGKIDAVHAWYKGVYSWQSHILEQRLDERHEKELSHCRDMMALVPELPKTFHKWIKEDALSQYHYLLYQPGKRKVLNGYCTCCKRAVEIDTRKQKPKRKVIGKCPECGRKIIFMPQSAQLNGSIEFGEYRHMNRKWACIFQKIKGGFVGRFFECEVVFFGGGLRREAKYGIYESCRTFYMDTDIEHFEYRVYKNRGSAQWCPDGDRINCGEAFLYTRNLPTAMRGTEYQYCSVWMLQKAYPDKMMPIWRFMYSYRNRKFYEFLIKTGLTEILLRLVDASGPLEDTLDEKGRSPEEIFRVSKPYMRLILGMKPRLEQVRLIQQCFMDDVMPTAQEINRWFGMFGGDDETLGMINAHKDRYTISQFLNYIEKQTKACDERAYNHTKSDWKDYIGWCVDLGYDLDDKYYFFPPNLEAAHDGAYKEHKKKKDRIRREKEKRIARKISEICAKAIKGGGFEMKTDSLMIVVPKDADDIKREGNIQHHCVGGYAERVAKGETMILFVRKVSSPNTPFYTMEWKNNKVVQCRGKRNCDMTDDVKAFVRAFEKLMRKKKTRRKAAVNG